MRKNLQSANSLALRRLELKCLRIWLPPPFLASCILDFSSPPKPIVFTVTAVLIVGGAWATIGFDPPLKSEV